MKKFLLSFFALSLAMLAGANPSGNYHVTKALIHYVSDSYKFANGEEWEVESGDDEYAWDCEIAMDAEGNCTLYNLLADGGTLTGTYDAETSTLVLPAQKYIIADEEYGDYEMAICGGIKGYTEAQALMNYVDSYSSYVTSDVLAATVQFDQATNTFSLTSPILVYTPYDAYAGYVGYAYSLFSELVLAQEQVVAQGVTITVNDAQGVRVVAVQGWDNIDIEFQDGCAEVSEAMYIRIYNVDPFLISSVEVNGEAIEALEAGRYYFIEVTEETRSVNITVEEQEVVEMTMMVYVEGLDLFDTLVILDKDGELGKAICTKEQLSENELTNVVFTNLDLPLQVYGTWAYGTNGTMEVTVDGEAIAPIHEGPTSALFMDIEIADDQFLTISLKAEEHALYLRGAMNDWGVDEDYKFTQSVNENGELIFTLTGVEFPASTEFKLADEDWDEYNWGGENWGDVVPANEPVVLDYSGYNLQTTYDVNRDMVFTFNLASKALIIEGEPGEPVIPTPEEKVIYLRGEMNGWGIDEAYRFKTEDNILYTLTGVTILEGEQFKIADANWSEVNIGAYEGATIVSANEDFATCHNGWNMATNFVVTPEAVIEFNIVTNILYINTETSGIESVNADTLQSKWYNLQGIEVNKAQLLPGNIYINNGKKVMVK